MAKRIAVLDSDSTTRNELCDLLETNNFPISAIASISEVDSHIEKDDVIAVVIDIDSVPIDNRTIRDLTLKYPGVRFLCTSQDRFHPELKDAICYHIYACLNKPVDPEELLYWIKSIYAEEQQ